MYGGGDLVVGRHDPTEERKAPRLPTPVSFPDFNHLLDLNPQKWSIGNEPDLFGLRLKWQYATGLDTDLSIDMWKTINIDFKPVCDIRELLGKDGAKFYPPEKWMQEPEDRLQRSEVWPTLETEANIGADQESKKLFNGRQWPKRGDFYDRIKELKYDNEDGFRGFARIETRDGRPPPRLTYGRPFFEQLDMVVQYWDTSLDEYIPPEPKSADSSAEILCQLDEPDEPRKKTKLSADNGGDKEQDVSQQPSDIVSGDSPLSPVSPESPINSSINRYSRFSRIGKGRNNSPPPPPGTYKGWRFDTGRHMPSGARDQIVKVFVELALWPFSQHVDNFERTAPRLSMQKLRVMVPLTKRVWRDPITREDARKGIVSGPALGISSRHMHSFAENRFNSDLDLLREVGAILLIAQERSREGRKEKGLGEGMWWSEKPRFAGMPYEVPGEYQADQEGGKKEDGGDRASEKESVNGRKKKERDRLLGGSRRRPKDSLPPDMTVRQRAIHAYKSNTPPLPAWDSKAVYHHVGKDTKSDYDEAFLISCVNHHISILKLTVHKAYLEYFEHGTVPTESLPEDWSSPVLQRTKWYDLISPTDRADAFCSMWALGGYLSREP